jgi:hypothetical protein
MRLVLPFSSALSPAAGQALSTLQVPALERLLAALSPTRRDQSDEFSLSPPHERALGFALGWPLTDGLLPLAAVMAQADGWSPQPGEGWGLLQPTHWHLGTEQVSLADPEQLALSDEESRVLFEAVRSLFEDDTQGWRLHWASSTRWYAVHDSLTDLPTASPDRVIGRNVDWWLGAHTQARHLRRLQAEVQMLLHSHPLNATREARGQLVVNSFWLSGTGAVPADLTWPADLHVNHALRAPALAEDWTAWAEAWAALDAGPLADLLRRHEAGEAVSLTLAGERHAQTYAPAPRPWYRRGWLAPTRVHAAPVLSEL